MLVCMSWPNQDRNRLLKRLAIEMPSRSRADLSLHDDWYRMRKLHRVKIRDLEQVRVWALCTKPP
jgi:hypothetical protein